MGLLDDAIREHLDLKRRHGADPTEVSRLEQEALSPVRRTGEQAEPEEPAAAELQPPREPAPEVVAAEPQEQPVDPRESDSVHQPTTEFRVEDHHDEEHDEPPPAARPEPAAHADEDVLEETPDFLQETPEHDRLWFEQRPPRDFDFDD